jgi:hypothetical protein
MPTRLGWYPANQASTNSLVVPVLPARSLRPSRAARAAVPERVTSCIMLSMMKALRGSSTRSPSSPARFGFASARGLPRSSTILRMK